MTRRDVLRYIIVFIITVVLFTFTIWLSTYLNNIKLSNIKNISNKIAIDISSSETQFQLLQNMSCKDVSTSTLSSEINNLSQKIYYSEQNIKNVDEVRDLKKFYSLLEIKDYLLMQKIKEKCNIPVVPIFYFYTAEEDCDDCVKQSAVLSKLSKDFPELRVYSFDYNLDLSALRTLIKTFKIEDTKFPIVYMGGESFSGFQDEESIKKALPELEKYAKKKELKRKTKKPRILL